MAEIYWQNYMYLLFRYCSDVQYQLYTLITYYSLVITCFWKRNGDMSCYTCVSTAAKITTMLCANHLKIEYWFGHPQSTQKVHIPLIFLLLWRLVSLKWLSSHDVHVTRDYINLTFLMDWVQILYFNGLFVDLVPCLWLFCFFTNQIIHFRFWVQCV